MDTFRSANRRAVSMGDNPRSMATSRATLFQIPHGGVAVEPGAPVGATAAHSHAISVCSTVRSPLSDFPIRFTSLKSVAYRSLVNVGGGGGRNWVGVSSAIGVTVGTCVNAARGKFGGVDCQRPGKAGRM